ncbi:MAG: hypothetical protein JXA43_02820, partial [Candidatus Diapherotrites archaeon]|nr:hypothetical protein [Candidatus Diapherotrites archaeon]
MAPIISVSDSSLNNLEIPRGWEIENIYLDAEGPCLASEDLNEEMIGLCASILDMKPNIVKRKMSDPEKMVETFQKALESQEGREKFMEWGEENIPNVDKIRGAIDNAHKSGLNVYV